MHRLRGIILAVIGLALLAGAAITLSGCSRQSATAPSVAPAPASQTPAIGPTLELVAPVANSEVPAGDVKMSVKATGLKFVMASNTNVAGEGHVHFTLDGQPFKMSVTPDYMYAGVQPGRHVLEAELVQNDTKSFTPPVKQEITFTAK